MSGKNLAVTDVEKYTNSGHHYLQQGLFAHAKNAYEIAFTACTKLKNTLIERSCAFNLGAVHIALHEAEIGLKWLQKAVPPVNERDGTSNGDVFYNLGIAYELLNNIEEALKYYELAYQEYHFQSNDRLMEVIVVKKAAVLCKRLKNPLQAVKFYKIAARLFFELENGMQQALCLSQMGAQLVRCGKYDGALETADDAMALCKSLRTDIVLGKLLNELGLIYTQCHSFVKAADCFNQAVTVFKGIGSTSSREEAVLLQNMGAVYNSLGEYQKALMLHESAASLHARNYNRGLQGQCFTNLAFAYSQLNDLDTAGECYMHAVQAAKDARDKKGQWQAMEGLGSVCFNQGKTNKAVVYFKLALRILVDTREYTNQTEERLLGKITDALHHNVKRKQVTGFLSPSDSVQEAGLFTPNNANIASEGKYLTREFSTTVKEADTQKMSLKKVTKQFDDVAQGIGRYSTDDDLSVASSVSRSKEQTELLSSDRLRLSKNTDLVDSDKYKRREKGLLRTQTHDSELEWQREVKEAVSKEHSFGAHCIPGQSGGENLQFVEKLHPISSNDESDSTVETSEKPKKFQNREKIKKILKGEVSAQVHEWKGGNTSGEQTLPSESPVFEASEEPGVVDDQQSMKASLESSNSSQSNLWQYQRRIRRKSLHDEASSVISTNEETEEDLSSVHSDDVTHNKRKSSTVKPSVPIDSPPQTQILLNTYEEPLPVKNSPSSSDEKEEHFGANYFHPSHLNRESYGAESLSESGPVMGSDDPLYQSIKSVKKESTDDMGESAQTRTELKSPELPPRPHNLSRGEEEEYLRKVHKDVQQKKRDSEERTNLPSKTNRKSTKSQMCLIM